MTNRGLTIKVPRLQIERLIVKELLDGKKICYLELGLNCLRRGDRRMKTVYLESIDGLHWLRMCCNELGESSCSHVTDKDLTIYIHNHHVCWPR